MILMKKILILKIVIILNLVFLCFKAFSDDTIKIGLLVPLSGKNEELGKNWLDPSLFRVGASSLLNDVERQLYHFALGRYANMEKIAIS